MLESKIQAEIIKWARSPDIRAKYPCVSLLHSSLNGAKLSSGGLGGAREKATGLLAGIPDLHLPIPNSQYSSLYIEMKNEKGVLTPSQKKLIPILASYGNKVAVCRSSESAIDTIINYINDVSGK